MKNSHSLAKKLIEPGIFILFAVITLIVRSQSFHMRIIDWDETLYYLWAKDMLHGYLPYVNIMEDKPIGISFVYLTAFLAFGKSMFSIRILAWLSITCSAYFLYKIGKIIGSGSYLSGILAGLLYSFYSYFNMGIAANTEIFFAFFTIFAFYLLFNNLKTFHDPNPKTYKTFFLIGLSLGIGFLIKYVVAFDIISMLIIIFVLTYFSGGNKANIKPSNVGKLFLILIAGLVLPQIFILLLYTIKGQLHTYIDANLFILKYTPLIAFSLKEMLYSIAKNLSPYKIFFYSFLLLIFFKRFSKETRINITCLIIWTLIILFELLFCLTRYWDHYTIQLLPPFCLLSALLTSESLKLIDDMGNKCKYIWLSSILIIVGSMTYITNKNPSINNDKIKIINHKIEPFYNDRQSVLANYISKKIGTGKYIFILSEDYIIYDMTQSKYPTRFIMPYMIIDPSFNSIINQKEEIKKILVKNPEYIIIPDKKTPSGAIELYKLIISNHPVYSLLKEHLQKDYVLETRFSRNDIFRLKR